MTLFQILNNSLDGLDSPEPTNFIKINIPS